ncbi:MAG: ribosome maturation factor RimP [Acidobacteria bacterium]|nr:ribosome maturation factor RimP [Acidobacteriota bacterium]
MGLLGRIREIADRVAASEGMELVEVEFLGRGRHSVLRIFVDKPEGITHRDCQLDSEQDGAILDVEDLIPSRYTLEVSSPGLDRKLLKPGDYRRFAGRRVKVVLKTAQEGRRRFEGRLLGMEEETIRLDTGQGQIVSFGYPEVEKANLVPEF